MKQLSLYAFLGAVALTLTGCGSEEMVTGYDKVAEKDELRYMRVVIANPAETRADAEFENGLASENEVKNMYFRFFDAAGNYIESHTQALTNVVFDDAATAGQSVGKIKEMVVQLSLDKGTAYPSYAMCLINPVDFTAMSSVTNMHEFRNQVRQDYRDNQNAFTMDNAVYYGNDPISGANQVKMSGTPILDGQLYSTKEAAEAADANAVEIYVERLASKVNFTLNQNGIQEIQTPNGYTLKFKPVAWTVNADADDIYAVKRFESTNADDDRIPTYSEVQQMLGTWTSWNAADLHRSYWGCSPSFYATEFPEVSDNIMDQAEDYKLSTNGAGIVVAPYKLRYYSFNQIVNPSAQSEGLGVTAFNNADGKQNWKYVLENTMGDAAFKSRNPKAAAPSVVLVGQYDVSYGGQLLPLMDKGFCTYNNNLYYRENPTGAPAGAPTILQALMNANGILAINQEGTLLTWENAAQNVRNYFEVAHPDRTVRGTQAVTQRSVTLQLKHNLPSLEGLWYRPMGSDVWQELKPNGDQTQEDLVHHINRLLWQQIGVAHGFEQNAAYFSIPIRHLGFTENEAGQPVSENGEIDWSKVRVGDFGLVRNHVYSITVDAIEGIGSGISSIHNPIVPPMDQNDYWVRYKVNILNWRVVPAQTGITLK